MANKINKEQETEQEPKQMAEPKRKPIIPKRNTHLDNLRDYWRTHNYFCMISQQYDQMVDLESVKIMAPEDHIKEYNRVQKWFDDRQQTTTDDKQTITK
jgi:hypothetical protein